MKDYDPNPEDKELVCLHHFHHTNKSDNNPI